MTLREDAINAIFHTPRNDGGFDGPVRLVLRQFGKRRPAVILAFPPKAAGTFFRTAAILAVNGRLVRTVHAQGGRDAQLYLPTFLAYYSGALPGKTLVGHVHMQALPANIHFLEAFDIRPIVMMRNIPDMLASYWDMLDSDPAARKDGLNCLIPEDFPELAADAKADFMGPWYASYFATWMGYAETDPERVCVLHYHDFKAEPAATLQRAVEHARVSTTRQHCQEALDRVWAARGDYRYNKGAHGRGATYFNANHIARLERMLGHYQNLGPHMDELLGRGEFAAAKAA